MNGVRKVSELIMKPGRTIIVTETDAANYKWVDIPDGTIRVNPETGAASVKLLGQSDWVPLVVQADNTSLMAIGRMTVRQLFWCAEVVSSKVTLLHEPVEAAAVLVVVNGVTWNLGPTEDYEVDVETKEITFHTALPAGATSKIVVVYEYVVGTAQNPGETLTEIITNHVANVSNPHVVTKAQIGLGNVTNDPAVKKIAESTDNALVRFDGPTGALVQDSLATLDDTGAMSLPYVNATSGMTIGGKPVSVIKPVAFVLSQPQNNEVSPRYVIMENLKATLIEVRCNTPPTATITVKLYKIVGASTSELASFSVSSAVTSFDMTDADLTSGDAICAGISGNANNVAGMTFQVLAQTR
jgi:hypothetical protein